jgi:hypothetical protein
MTNRITPAQIGMLGVHLAAAEFIRRGFIVAPTSRGAFGADLLVTDTMCQKAWSVQVKTKAAKAYDQWIVGKFAETVTSGTLIYIFVSFKDDQPEFLVVPSRMVAKHVRTVGGIQVFHTHDAAGTKSWRIFGNTPRLVFPLKREIERSEVVSSVLAKKAR